MKISENALQQLNDSYIKDCIDYRDNIYILAIKDNTNWPNVYPVLFSYDDDLWPIDKDEIGKINISKCKNDVFVENELVIIGGRCYPNNDKRYSHFVDERFVRGMGRDPIICLDIFAGSIDYNNGFVRFDAEMDELYQKYIDTQNKLYIKDEDYIVGPFILTVRNGDGYTIKKHALSNIMQAKYNTDFIFEPEQDEYTNYIKRYFLLEKFENNLFNDSTEIDFISNSSLIEWARSEYEKNTSQKSTQKDAISLLYQWIDRIPDIVKQTNRYDRLNLIKDSLGNYDNSISKFIELIPEVKIIKDKIIEIDAERTRLEAERSKIDNDIVGLKESQREEQEVLDELQASIDKLEAKKSEYQKDLEDKYIQEKQGLKEEIEKLQNEKDSLEVDLELERAKRTQAIEDEISVLKSKANSLRSDEIELKSSIYKLQKDFTNEQGEAQRILSDLVKSKTHFDFIRGKRFSDSDNDSSQYSYNYVGSSEEDFQSYEELRNRIIAILNSQGRKCDEHFVDNLLISTTQNLFTLFVGLPGTGKTSMARILGSCISGKDRFAEVSVGRGWTSHKDLLGFYNPLSGNFVESHKGLHNKLQDLNYEMKNNLSNNNPILYILLDEANLSPIEHYWSMFINDTDRNYEDVFEIDLGNGGLLNHKNAIRFIGTLNNDHTTEKISPRILDRVNLIYFKPEEIDQFATLQVLEELRISKSVMEKFCLVIGDRESYYSLDARLNDQKELYKKIKNHLKDYMNIFLSPRIDKAMERYCEVANRTMAEKHRPLDYFVAQRILPLISNSRKEHLSTLMDILCDFNLSKPISTKIVEQIIKKGEENFDMYDYFSIIG